MKKKLALLLLAAVSCVCFAFGFSACGGDDTATPGGTTDNTGGTTTTTHTMTFTAAKSATCTEAGNSAYYYCSDCGKYFSDANGTTEIQLSSTVIEALGHDYEAKFTWTSATDGYTATATQTCSRCNEAGETVDATVEITSQVAATCTEKGSTVYTATAAFSGGTETDTKTITLPATGHTYSTEWSSDGTYHWHAATCEHTDEISEKAEHTYEKDPNTGNYVCSVCGYEIDGASTGGGTSGSNYVTEGDNIFTIELTTSTDEDGTTTTSTTYYTNYVLEVTNAGSYTFTVSDTCKAYVYVEDALGNSTVLGNTDRTGDKVYTVTIDAAVGENITVTYIGALEDAITDTYTFTLSITYAAKDVVKTGAESNPYVFTNPSQYGADSFAATIAAGESFYFTVTNVEDSYGDTPDDTLAQIRFSYADDEGATSTSFELYVNGTKVDYGTYYYYCTTTSVTFCLKNVSDNEIKNTIYSEAYTATLSASDNELTITSNILDSNNSISYTLTVPANTSYILTLGSGTDENAAIYYLGYSSSTENTLILGKGATGSSYIITNSSSNPRSYYLNITYTGTTVLNSFKVYLTVANYDPDDYATYTELTLDTTAEASIDYSNNLITVYYSYTAASEGTYTLTLEYKLDTKDSYTWSNIYQSSATIEVNGESVTVTETGVHTITLKAGENKIVITCKMSAGTLQTTLTSGGEVIEDTTTALSLGANTVYDSTLYSFTATTAGTYTFTVSGSSGYAQFYESSSSYNALLDEGGSGNTSYSVQIDAGSTITLYITDGGSKTGFTVTVTQS